MAPLYSTASTLCVKLIETGALFSVLSNRDVLYMYRVLIPFDIFESAKAGNVRGIQSRSNSEETSPAYIFVVCREMQRRFHSARREDQHGLLFNEKEKKSRP